MERDVSGVSGEVEGFIVAMVIVVKIIIMVTILVLPCFLLVLESIIITWTMGINITVEDNIWDGNQTMELILIGRHALLKRLTQGWENRGMWLLQPLKKLNKIIKILQKQNPENKTSYRTVRRIPGTNYGGVTENHSDKK